MKSPSELSVASLLLYPKGDSTATREAQAFIRYKIKMASEGAISGTVQRLAEAATKEPLVGFLNGDLSLVPVPGHTPRLKGGLWVAEIICQEMVRLGLGLEVLPCLVRTEPVPRSSLLTKAGDRPVAADHYRSFLVEPVLPASGRILLVDDVVTRGATLFGGALRLREQFPSAEITALALARAHPGALTQTAEMLSPAVETIH